MAAAPGRRGQQLPEVLGVTGSTRKTPCPVLLQRASLLVCHQVRTLSKTQQKMQILLGYTPSLSVLVTSAPCPLDWEDALGAGCHRSVVSTHVLSGLERRGQGLACMLLKGGGHLGKPGSSGLRGTGLRWALGWATQGSA